MDVASELMSNEGRNQLETALSPDGLALASRVSDPARRTKHLVEQRSRGSGAAPFSDLTDELDVASELEDKSYPNEQIADARQVDRDADLDLFEDEVLAVEAPDEEVYGSVNRQR